VRLMFENSTVCLIVDELVCLPLSARLVLFVGWVVLGLFFGNDSG
jgi:hypothetical protein